MYSGGAERRTSISVAPMLSEYISLDGDNDEEHVLAKPGKDILELGEHAPVPPSSAGSTVGSSFIADLRELKQLHTEGVLTDEEFAQSKAALLNLSSA